MPRCPMVLSNCLHCGAISAFPSDLQDAAPICPQCGGAAAILAIMSEAEIQHYFPELATAPPNFDCQTMRILLVEDDGDTAKSLAKFLAIAGYDVEITGDGISALVAAESKPPDVVLLDLGLPGAMDGWEVARRLRQMHFARRPQVVAVTGYDKDEDRKRSYEAGIDFHFAKPADPGMLCNWLRRLESVLHANSNLA
jgi:CheY-like chemotaxis protein